MISSSGSLQARLFCFFALVTLIASVLPALFSRGTLYEDRLELAEKQALAHALFLRGILETQPNEEQMRRLFSAAGEASLRLPLVAAAGNVERESRIEGEGAAEMDNHDDRPEIVEARARGTGLSMRHSNSLGIDALYAAVSLQGGNVLRVAVPLADIRRGLDRELLVMALRVAAVAGFCLLLSVFVTRRIRGAVVEMAEAVSAISLKKDYSRLREVPGREFLPLARAVNHMADRIEEYVQTAGDQRRQLETVLDSMHEGVLVLGPNGRVRRWNRALAAMFPAVARGEGRPLIESLPVPALQRRVDGLLADAAGENAVEDNAVHFEMPAGRFLVAHLARPVERSPSLGAVIVVYDATPIMRLERARRDFVSNVSHELRTPLTAIASYAETLLASDDLRAEYRNFACIIHKHAAAMGRIINDMLELARIENEREAVLLAPTEAMAPLECALSSCRGQAEARGITFAVNLDDARVLANAQLLAQVFRNLLENACRYSPDGGEIRVSARKEGGEVLFILADNGPGIPKDELPRIFERFYQIKKERNSGTSGIGLAICKHIIERHGGRIWAESPYGAAATAMLFTLSAAPAAS